MPDTIQIDDGMFPVYLSAWRPTGDVYQDFLAAWKDSTVDSNPVVNATHTGMPAWNYASPQVWQRVPAFAPLYTCDVENNFEGTAVSDFMREYMYIPVVAVVAYVVLIFGGAKIMSNFAPFNLKWPLALWNLSLSLFSFCGVVRIVPHLLLMIHHDGFYYSMCHPAQEIYGLGASGVWAWMFCISKFPELVDTVFIVLRKRPLIFLHWYHHVTVLLFCWHSYATHSSAGLYFIAMNFSVHSIMYGYYFLRAVNMWPRFIPAILITIMQLAQMAVGIAVMVATYYYKETLGLKCNVERNNFLAGTAMYFSYFCLFLHFLVDRFILKRPAKKPVSKKKKQL